jgi:non-specific protein-tyrosine kinase
MTVDYYRTAFVKQWKVMLLCFLIVVLAVLLISKQMTPIYRVSVIMQITPRLGGNQPGVVDAVASERLMQTEAQLAMSEVVLREVASHFPPITLDQLVHRVTVIPGNNTQLFEIEVQDASEKRAAALANDIARTLLKQQSSLNSQANSQALQEIQQDLDSTQQHIDALLAQISEAQGKNKKQSVSVVSLQGQLSGWQQHYNQLQNEQAQLELLNARDSHLLQIVQFAQPSGHLVRPNIPLNLLASLPVALSLSILLALILETSSTYVRTPEALSHLLQWPVLAPLWRIPGIIDRQELVHLPDNEASNTESYRLLRANLGFSCVDRSLRTLAIISATPGDGRSVIAANLAIAMARVGKNTLLIDADLRHPVLHELFEIDSYKMGLSDAILTASTPESNSRRMRAQFLTPLAQGNTLGLPRAPHFSIDAFIYDVGITNLRVMPAGTLPPNPTELLDSRAMQRLFIALEQTDAEIIIFDTPALQGLFDASILAARVDGTLVIVDASRAYKGQLKQLKATLMQAGAHVLGCVMNKVRPGRYEAVSYPYIEQPEEEQMEEPPIATTRARVSAASVTRLRMLSATRIPAHAAPVGGRRSARRRS